MKKAFVIGHPINHSKSPLLHGFWLDKYQIDGTYESIDVAPSELASFVAAMHQNGLAGGNATIPHKEALPSLCDEATETAKTIGAVNTLYFERGKLIGDNTDKYGFLANLDQLAPNWDERNDQAIVLGAGGAARAILVGLIERGFKNIALLNRTVERAEALAKEFQTCSHETKIVASTLTQFAKFAPNTDFLVNSSAVGMNGTRFDGLDVSNLPSHAAVSDIVYTPLVTPLLADAEKAGLVTVDGLGMLLHQAVPGFEKWFGVRPEVTDELRNHILEA